MRRPLRLLALAFVLLAPGPVRGAEDAATCSKALAKASQEAWDGTLRVLLARAACRIAPTVEAVSALYDALGDQTEVACLRHAAPVVSVQFSPDSLHVATGCEDGTAAVWWASGDAVAKTKFDRPVVRAWFVGAGNHVAVTTRGTAADTVDLFLWAGDALDAPKLLAAGLAAGRVFASPTGEAIAAVQPDGQAVLWDRDGRIVKSMAALEASFAPLGATTGGALLVATPEGRAVLVSMKGAVKEFAFGRPVRHAAFRHSSAALAWGDDGHVAAFTAEGKRLCEVDAGGAIEGAFASPDANRIVVAAGANFFAFDRTGALLKRWAKQGTFTCGAFSDDGKRAFVVSGGTHATTWIPDEDNMLLEGVLPQPALDVVPSREGYHVIVRSAQGPSGFFPNWTPLWKDDDPRQRTCAVFSPEGDFLLDGTVKGGMSLVRLYGGDPLRLQAHRGAIVDAAFAAAGPLLATGSRDGTARIWSVAPSGTESVGRFRSPTWNVNCSWTHDRVAIVAGDRLTFTDGHASPIVTFVHPDSIGYFVSSDDRIGVVQTGSHSALVYAMDGRAPLGELQFGSTIGGMSLSEKDGRSLVFGQRSPEVRFFDAKCKPAGAMDVGDFVVAALFDHETKRVLVATASGKIRICGAGAGHPTLCEWQPPSPIDWASFAPKGELIVTLQRNAPTAHLWTTKGKLVAEFKGFAGPVTSFAFSWAGDAVVLPSKDKTARIFDLAGRELARLEHPDEVSTAQFLPGDERIVTTCKDGGARIWSRAGALVAVIRAHKGGCAMVGFDAKGERIVTVGEDRRARFWPGTTDWLLAIAERRAIRDFTDDERRTYPTLLR